MHITERAPVLSATSSRDCICIMDCQTNLIAFATSFGPAWVEKIACYISRLELLEQDKNQMIFAFSNTLVTLQDFVLEIGRPSQISTRSPSPTSLLSS